MTKQNRYNKAATPIDPTNPQALPMAKEEN
jgi:hypothetical protein